MSFSKWNILRDQLSQSVEPEEFKLWVEPMRPAEDEAGALTLSCPNAFHRTWVRDHYLPRLRQLARQIDPGLKVCLNVVRSAPKQMELPKMGSGCSQLNTRFRFENFVAGGGNEYACAAARALAQGRNLFASSLYLVSPTGLGKSHLTQAVGHYVLGDDTGCRVTYLTAEDFANQMISALRKKSMDQFKDRFRKCCDVLLMEDMPFLAGKDKTQEELVFTLDALINAGKRVIFTGHTPPAQIKGLAVRLQSRLDSSITVPIDPPDHRTRVKILQREARALGVVAPLEPLEYLAETITCDIRRLLSALSGVLAKSSLTARPIDIKLAAEVAGQISCDLRRLSPERILGEVAKAYGLDTGTLTGKSRKKVHTRPRNVAMYLCRRHTDASFKTIGGVFNRDHATVMYGVDKVDREKDRETKLDQEIRFIEQRLGLA